MGSLTARPLAVAGIATLVTAVTITGSRVRPVEISPPRLLAESVQLQTFSTPKAAATAAAIADPGQILTNAVEAAVALAAATAWFIAFPITLPVSLVLGQAFTTVPFAGILQSGPILFFGIPALLVSSTVNQLALSLGLNSPFSAASRAGAAGVARKPATATAAINTARSVSARAAKNPAAAASAQITQRSAGRSSAARSH